MNVVILNIYKLLYVCMSKHHLICEMYSNRPKLSHPESQHLLKDFCITFTGAMDKSQITLEQAAMCVHMFYSLYNIH